MAKIVTTWVDAYRAGFGKVYWLTSVGEPTLCLGRYGRWVQFIGIESGRIYETDDSFVVTLPREVHQRSTIELENAVMGMNREAILRKIAQSSASSGGTNIFDGRGRLAVKKVSLDDKYSGQTFIVEFVVVSSSKIPVVDLETQQPVDVTPNVPGSECSWIQLLDKWDSAPGNIKGFFCALWGVSEADVSEDDFVATLEEVLNNNAAYGMVIDYSTFRKITRENKQQITIPKWFNVDQSAEEINKTKAWMESLVATQKAG